MPKNDGPPAPGAIHKPDSTVAVAKSQPASKPVSVAVTSAEDSKSRLNPTDTAALDTLFSQLDENYKTSYDLSQMTSQVFQNDTQCDYVIYLSLSDYQEINFTDQLADIAKLIGGGLGDFNVDTAKKAATSQIFTDRPPVIPVNPQGLIRFANCIPSPAKVVVQECFDGGEDGVKISITSLTVDQIKLADLKVSDSEIELSVPANSTGGNLASLVVTANNKASFKFDVNNISAKMSKKKCQIDIFAKSLK